MDSPSPGRLPSSPLPLSQLPVAWQAPFSPTSPLSAARTIPALTAFYSVVSVLLSPRWLIEYGFFVGDGRPERDCHSWNITAAEVAAAASNQLAGAGKGKGKEKGDGPRGGLSSMQVRV